MQDWLAERLRQHGATLALSKGRFGISAGCRGSSCSTTPVRESSAARCQEPRSPVQPPRPHAFCCYWASCGPVPRPGRASRARKSAASWLREAECDRRPIGSRAWNVACASGVVVREVAGAGTSGELPLERFQREERAVLRRLAGRASRGYVRELLRRVQCVRGGRRRALQRAPAADRGRCSSPPTAVTIQHAGREVARHGELAATLKRDRSAPPPASGSVRCPVRATPRGLEDAVHSPEFSRRRPSLQCGGAAEQAPPTRYVPAVPGRSGSTTTPSLVLCVPRNSVEGTPSACSFGDGAVARLWPSASRRGDAPAHAAWLRGPGTNKTPAVWRALARRGFASCGLRARPSDASPTTLPWRPQGARARSARVPPSSCCRTGQGS